MLSFCVLKLSILGYDNAMASSTPISGRRPKTAGARIRRAIQSQGERIWRLNDFPDLPASAVASTLSRMVKEGTLQRIERGVYYRSRATIVGQSMPSNQALTATKVRQPLQPAGLTAAAML